uniref:RNase H type-1 domain-containing protein n=1 Tax=Manihot esculenta TaxID=3983 RepID=A0A2C9VWX9_MANES
MRRIGDGIEVSIWRDPWLLDDMPYIQLETDTSSQLTNVSDLLTEAVQTETKGGGFMILWSLWLGINDVVWNGKKCDHHYVISKARSTLLKSQLAQQITERQPVERVEASWKAPMAGQFKCNVDVSIQQNGIFDFGVIINDSNGLCCAESDCLILVHTLQSKQSDRSYFAMLIDNCNALVNDLVKIFFSFVKKLVNQVAHTIVRAACL